MAAAPFAAGRGAAEQTADSAAFGKKAKAGFKALVSRYGMLDKRGEYTENRRAVQRLLPRGRRFMKDVDALVRRLEKTGGISHKEVHKEMKQQASAFATVPDPLAYRVVGPRRVVIVYRERPEAEVAEARWEDGKWRIHLIVG